MEQFYKVVLDRFNALHTEIKKSIQALDPAALDWVPVGETNSINVLVTHLAAAEKFWAADIPLGRDSERVRAEEFLAANLEVEDLDAILDGTLAQIELAFEQLKVSDLEKKCYSKQHNLDVSAAWAILHALEHSALHVGHLQLTAQLWLNRGR
jgi:hypothetical protein